MPIEAALQLQAVERPRQTALEQLAEILDTALDKHFEAEQKMAKGGPARRACRRC